MGTAVVGLGRLVTTSIVEIRRLMTTTVIDIRIVMTITDNRKPVTVTAFGIIRLVTTEIIGI